MNNSNQNQQQAQGAQATQGSNANNVQVVNNSVTGRQNPMDIINSLESYSFETVFPKKGEAHIDYVKALSKGMTGLDIEALSAKTKLPVKVGNGIDAYREMFPKLNDEELSEVWLSSLESYKQYRDGQYSKVASNTGIAPDNLLFKHLGLSNNYTSNAMIRGSEIGHTDVDGFTQLLTEEQAAMKVGLAYDPSKDVWMNIDRVGDKAALTVKQGIKEGQPQNYFEIRDWGDDLSQEQVLSFFGVSKYQKSNAVASFSKGVWESTLPALGKALAWTVDKPMDVYEWASTGKITGNKPTDRVANTIGNASGALTHRNADETAGAFENWQSFALNLGTVVGQLATMRGVGGATFGALKGVNPMLAQKAASLASMGQMAAYMSYEMDQELGSMGWSEEMRTSLSMATFPIIFASEKFIGANNITNFLKSEYREVQKAIVSEIPKGLVNSKGQFVNKAAKATFLEKVAQGAVKMGQSISKYADEGNLAASVVRQSAEESLEEFSESTMEIALKTMGDHFLRNTAQKNYDYYYGAEFDDEKNTITYADGRVEQLDLSEYNGAKQDFEQAVGIVENQEGLFDYSIDRWFAESVEASAMGAIGGGVGGALFNRAKAKKDNAQKMLFQKMAIKIAQDEKYMGVVDDTVKKMMERGVFGRTDIDEDGESIAKSGKPSQASQNAKLMMEELQINVDLAREFDIANPVILKINGGDKNMLNELFNLKKKKKELENEEIALQNSELGEEEKSRRAQQISSEIESINKDILRYSEKEGSGKYSRAYNDRAKEMIGSFKFAERFVLESFNKEYNASIENEQAELDKLQNEAHLIAQNIQRLKNIPVDQQTKKVKNEIKKAEKDLASVSKKMDVLNKNISNLVSGMASEFEKFKTKSKDVYWGEMLKASQIDFHYKDYRSFVEDGGLDSMIDSINKERELLSQNRESASSDVKTQLENLINAQSRIEGLKEWQDGKGLENSTEFKAMLGEIASAIQALNTIDLKSGLDSNLQELNAKLQSTFDENFFNRLNQISNKDLISKINELNENIFDLDVNPGTSLGEYKRLLGANGENAKIKAQISQLSDEMNSGNLTEEEKAEKSQAIDALTSTLDNDAESLNPDLASERIAIYEQYGQDGDAIGDIIQNAASDAYKKSEFSKKHLGWMGGAESVFSSITENISNGANEDQALISRESLSPQDWLDIYIKDIVDRVNAMKAKQDDIADPKKAIAEIDEIIKLISTRRGNILFQTAFNEMQNSKNHKQHLTDGVDYAIPFTEGLMMNNQMRSLLQDLVSLKSNLEAIAGSRSVRQLKANAKNLEYQRLSMFHILTQTGTLLGPEFKALVESIKEVEYGSENSADIEKSIAESEGQILKAKQIIFANRDKLLSDANFKKLFYSDAGSFLFLGGREQTFRILVDQNGVDYLDDDFNPGKTITEQRGPLDKTGYMVFMTFLEEAVSIDPVVLYEAEKKILEESKNTNNKVASAEQMMSIKQTVAFLDAGHADVMKKLSYLIINNISNKASRESTLKSTEGILFNSVFLRGNPGVGKTNVMLPMAIQMHMDINDIKSLKIRIVDPTGDLESRLSELNAAFGGKRNIVVEKMDRRDAVKNGFNEDYDILVWDEASVLKSEHLDTIKKSGKSKPMIFLGDEAQMQSIDESSLMSPASRRMYRTTPVSTSYRSSVFQIDDLRNAFRYKLVNSGEPINFPKLFSDNVDGRLVGAKYASGEDGIIKDFFNSKSKSKALIFLRAEDVETFYRSIQEGKRKVDWEKVKNHIFILETNLEIDSDPVIGGVEIKSIQGMSVDEAYVNISFNDLGGIGNKTLPGRAGLTAVSRARNFVSLIGPAEMNMNSKNQVVWNDGALQGQTEEQIQQQRDALELDRANRIDSLNNALDGLSVAETKSTQPRQPGQPRQPKSTTKKKPLQKEEIFKHAQSFYQNHINGVATNASELFSDPRYDSISIFKFMVALQNIKAQDLNFGQIPIENEILKKIKPETDSWVEEMAQIIFKKPDALSSFNEDRMDFYHFFKDDILYRVDELRRSAKTEDDTELYLASLKNLQVKQSDGSGPAIIELIPGAALVDTKGKIRVVQDIYKKGDGHYVVFSGSKRPIKIETLKKYKLPTTKKESDLEDRMHNNSALNFASSGAFYTSSATIMVSEQDEFSLEEYEILRGAKAEFVKQGVKDSRIVFHPEAMLFSDNDTSARTFNNVFLVKTDPKNAKAFLARTKNPHVLKMVQKHGLDVIADKIATIGSFGDIEIDYFTKANLPLNPTKADLDSIQQQIETGFQSRNTEDKFREENINLNLARLFWLRFALSKNSGKNPVDLGPAIMQDDLTISDRVVYDFKSSGQSFSQFASENEKKGISFFTKNAQAREFERKDGSRYWAYEIPWRRAGETHALLVTMPSFSQMRNESLDYKSVIKELQSSIDVMKKNSGNASFFSSMNKSFIGRFLQSNNKLLIGMVNSSVDFQEFLSIKDNNVELKGANDKERILSAERLRDAISEYFNNNSIWFRVGELYLPFSKTSPLIRTKATLISQPQLFFTPDISIKQDFGNSDTQTVAQPVSEKKKAKRPPRGSFLNRVADLSSKTDPRISKEHATEIIRAILGDKFVEESLEFGNDLGTHENLRILGMMANGKIKIFLENNGIRSRTPKHEALHVVFNYMISPEKKASLLEYGRERKAFEKGVSKDKVTDIEAEEWLADDYAYRGNASVKRTKNNLWNRFVNYVAGIAHAVGLFKSELDYLYWQMDRGVFRDAEITNADNITMFSLEQDESEVENAQGTRKKYDSTMLLRIFGDMKSVERISFVFAKEIYALSPLAGYEDSNNFSDAIRRFEEFAVSEEYVADIDENQVLESTGKALKDTMPEDVKMILNSEEDAWTYFDYVMQNKDIRHAMIERTFPGVDVDTLEYRNAGEDTISDDKSLQDFRKKTNDFIRLAIRTTPFFSFSIDENGNVVRGESNGFVDFEDLQNSLILAGIEMRSYGVDFREYSLNLFIDTLTKMAHKNGIDSRRGRNILSFVNRLTTLSPDGKGIVDLIKESKNPEQVKFMNEFINGLLSTYVSLYQKEVSDFSVEGFSRDKLKIKKLVFEGSNETKFKNRLKNNIRSFTMQDNSQVKSDVHKKINKQFQIDESGLKLSDGTQVIRREGDRYVFEDHKDLTIIARTIMSHLGLSIFPKHGLSLMLRKNDRNLTKHKSTFSYITELISSVNETGSGHMTPRDFMANNLMKMLLSVNHNHSFFQNVKTETAKLKEGEVLSKEQVSTILKNSDHFELLDKSLRNVDNAIEDSNENDEFNYKVFKPTDFYKFFQVLGEVKAQTTTYGGMNFFYRPDGKKEYLFGNSSGFFERFSNGLEKTKQMLSANGIKSKNLLLSENTPYTVEGIEEVKGMKQSDINKGVTKPNTSDLLTIGINLFLESLASTETRNKMTFMNTNISDSGYMFATTYSVSGYGGMFLTGNSKGDFRNAQINDYAINAALKGVYENFSEEHKKSLNRWMVLFGQSENTSNEIIPRDGFLAIDQGSKTQINLKAPIHEELARINKIFMSYGEVAAEKLRDLIMNSDLVLNRDYVIKNGRVQFGKATSGNIDLETGRAYSIYNIKDANRFLSAYHDYFGGLMYDAVVGNDNESTDKIFEEMTKIRRDIFGKQYLNFSNMLSKQNVKISRDYKLPKSTGHGVFGNGYVQTANENEWNPVLEAYFMGYHIMNTSFNELWLGTQFQYGGLSTADMSKRSKPFTTPGITAGRINPYTDPDGMGAKAQVVIISDEVLSGMGFDESVYNTSMVATDGIGWANPLFYMFMDHSFGGRFSTMDKGMRKPITSYNNPLTGLSIQLKQAEHVLSYDVFSNSLTAERMFKEMLEMTEDGLSDIFMNAFKSFGGHNSGQDAWMHALNETAQYIKDNNLHDKLVWQFINPSAVKTGIHRVNKYSMEKGFIGDQPVNSISIDTSEIRMVLNPYQDFNDNERMAPPTQMLAIMGIGEQNSESISKVNNNLSKIFNSAFNDILKKIEKNSDSYILRLLERAVDAMPTYGNFAEMISNPRISLNLPQLTEKAQQILANNITKEGTKRKYAGLRANQAPGSILDVYEKDGQIYMLSDLRRMGHVTEKDGVTSITGGFSKRKLNPMTKNSPAEVIVPFSYMAKFGVNPNETLQDIYTIKLNSAVDKKTSINFMKNGELDIKAMKDFITANYDKIDIENTPLMRAMNSLIDRKNQGAVEEDDLSGSTIGAQIENFQALQALRESMSNDVNYKSELLENLDMVEAYFNALDESLNMFAVRIPTSNLGSGFRGRVVGFVNDMGNTIYTSELKNILDGSDYDIDQLSIFLKFVNSDFTMPEEGSVKSLQNEIVQTLMDVYKTESGNDESIYNQLSLDKLSELADQFEKRAEKVVNDPGHNADDYTASIQGSDSIDRFANLSSVYSYISQLSREQIGKIIPWAYDGIVNQGKGEESIIHRLGLFLNSSTDNAKVLINGRFGITKDATNIVGAMLLSGYNEEMIGDFLQSDVIKKVFDLVERGYGVTESAREYDPYTQVRTMLKNIKKEITSLEINADMIPSLQAKEEALILERDKYVQSSQYFDKRTKRLNEEQFFKDSETRDAFAQFNNQIKDASSKIKLLKDYETISSLKDFLIKGESLKRIAHVVSLRKGFKAVSSDFDYYYDSLSAYLGMDVKDFAEGDKWDIDSHISYFTQVNNEAAYGTKEESQNAIDFERQVAQIANISELVRKLPHFNSYAIGLAKLKSIYEKQFLLRSEVFSEWANDYLAGQERTTFLSKNQRTAFFNELGKFFLSIHFKENYKGKPFDLGLHNSGVRPDSILKSIDISTPEGRNLYALQFPQFIMAMKHADDPHLLKVHNGRDYSDWFDLFSRNEFLERLGLNDNNERSYLVLEDSYNLTENNIYKLRSEYEKLPLELRQMLEIYSLITNGFNAPAGSINDVMGTTILEGVSSTLDDIHDKVKEDSPILDKWKASFLKVLPHAEGMSRYYSQKDRAKGSERETVLNARKGDGYSDKLRVGRKISKGVYAEEYLRVGKLGIPYDPDVDVTTNFEPLLGLSSLEIDSLMHDGSLVKQFVRPHNYLAYYNDKDNFYVLPNGFFVRLDLRQSDRTTAVFVAASPEQIENLTPSEISFDQNTGLKKKANGQTVYSGKLTKDTVLSNPDKLFVIEGYMDISKNNYAQRDVIRTLDNSFDFILRKTQSGKFNLFRDGKNEANPEFISLVDSQIQSLKSAANGREIVFPEKGFSKMSELEIKMPFGYEYLMKALATEFGVDFKSESREPTSLTEQDKIDALKDVEILPGLSADEDYGNSQEPVDADAILAGISKAKQEGKENKNNCATN